ncbi:MAG: tetratricopeptide repeat protein [Acidobacteriota bacterium]
MESKPLRIIAPLAVLLLFYWAIYVAPLMTGKDSAILNAEQAHEIFDESRFQLHEKKYQEALELTERLNKAFPQNHIYLEQLATIHHYLGNFKEEADAWERYMLYSPTPLDACPQFGEAYRALNRIPEMFEACKKCYELDPRNTYSIFFLALSYERLGQLEKAQELYEKGVEIYPIYPDLRIGLTRIHIRLGNLAQARAIITKVYEEYPDNVDGLLAMGVLLRAEGRAGEAKMFLERGVELSPRYTDFYIVLAGIAESEGNREDAVAYYDKVLELAPDNPDIESKRKRLLGG